MRTRSKATFCSAVPHETRRMVLGATGVASWSVKFKAALAAAAAALLVAGCGGDALWAINNDCDEEMAATVRELGQPDSISKVSGWDTDVVIYIYRSIGLKRSFEWGPYRDCKGTDEHFTPR